MAAPRRVAQVLRHTQHAAAADLGSDAPLAGDATTADGGSEAGPPACRAAAAALSHQLPIPERIIDCHMHFYDPNRPGHSGLGSTGPLRRVCLSHQALALCGQHGVTGTVLVECSDPVEDNQWLLDMSDTDDFIVGVVGHLEPGPSFCSNVSRFAGHPRFVGVRPTPPRKSVRCSIEELRHLRDNGLVLDQMAGSLEQMHQFIYDLRQVPGLRVVVNHMGNPDARPGGECVLNECWQS